jgi:hypothetical protein
VQLVEALEGDAGGGPHLVHPDRLDTAPVEERLGRVEDPVVEGSLVTRSAGGPYVVIHRHQKLLAREPTFS